MRLYGYVHPEFGLFSPTPRLRRELRMAFFSVLFGIGIGVAAVIALGGNKTADKSRVPHGVDSASVISEARTYNGPKRRASRRSVIRTTRASRRKVRLRPIPRTTKSTLQQRARAIINLVATFPLVPASRA
jgi:hypothetical protein